MKEKIVSQLKAKLSTIGVKNLSNARINAIADKLSTKIADENEIDSKLDELNEIYPFADIAKDDDRLRTLETKEKKPAQTKQSSKDDQDDEEKSKDDTPAWAKALIDKVTSLEKDKKTQSIQERIKGHDKLKDVPAILIKGRALPEKDEDIDGWIEQVQSDFTEFQQDLVNKGLASSTKPAAAGIKTDNVDADIKEWANKGKPISSDTKK